MKPCPVLPFILLLCMASLSALRAQEDIKPWEKYGLSQTEWKTIQDSGIALAKVEELLKAGISISEYAAKPWIKFGLSERAYINKRRSGLSAYDIELEATADRGGWKGDNKGAFSSEATPLAGNKDLLLSFVLPGYQQHRINHPARSKVMIALAAGSVAGTLFLSVKTGTADFTPMFLILVPDMFWSMLDFKFSKARQDVE